MTGPRASFRRLPVGAEPHPGGGVHFRVWAPDRRAVEVVLEPAGSVALEPEEGGWFSGRAGEAGPGTRYRFRLDGEETALPDPASRYQPDGPGGSSQVVDPDAFPWTDAPWPGVSADPARPVGRDRRRAGAGGRSPGDGPGGPETARSGVWEPCVIYEMHVGTFTPEGTWAAAAEKLPRLAELGITVLEVMPVADFPGDFGWGYDGVFFFAPYHGYGTPDDFRRFVDRAHALGLGVILDVVYNHFGPEGNVLGSFTSRYVNEAGVTDWGPTPNFDGPGSEHVRAFFRANVRHWIEEYHLDGLRFDATQSIHDDSPEPILRAMAREAREAAGERRVLLVAENEPQDSALVRAPEAGGHGLDLQWNDDFHHSVRVALTGHREGYYTSHGGRPQELVSALKHGFLYQGQWYRWQRQRRGTPLRGLPRHVLVHFLENHDQVSNRPDGTRLGRLVDPGSWRAATALLLLGPRTPMLFQGQEFGASAPFVFFADQPPELARLTREGRSDFLRQFPSFATPEAAALLADPADPRTFRRCKLDWDEWERNEATVALHRDLLRLRREDPTFRDPDGSEVDGAVLGSAALVLRWFGASAPDRQGAGNGTRDRLLLVNLGTELRLSPAPEPLLAPPPGCRWRLLWSSESPRYGGRGTAQVETAAWNLPGRSALAMAAEPLPEASRSRTRAAAPVAEVPGSGGGAGPEAGPTTRG